MRVEMDGALDWYKLWGSRENEAAHYGITVTEDSVYAFSGLGGYGLSNQDLNLLRYSLDGELLSNLTWGSWRNESAWDMTLIGDTFYLLGQVILRGWRRRIPLSRGEPFPPVCGPGTRGTIFAELADLRDRRRPAGPGWIHVPLENRRRLGSP
jgi:hypothetical protein